jgi:hypothetical protein
MDTNFVPVPQHPHTCGHNNGPASKTVIRSPKEPAGGFESMISGHPKQKLPSPFILKQIEVSHDVSGVHV